MSDTDPAGVVRSHKLASGGSPADAWDREAARRFEDEFSRPRPVGGLARAIWDIRLQIYGATAPHLGFAYGTDAAERLRSFRATGATILTPIQLAAARALIDGQKELQRFFPITDLQLYERFSSEGLIVEVIPALVPEGNASPQSLPTPGSPGSGGVAFEALTTAAVCVYRADIRKRDETLRREARRLAPFVHAGLLASDDVAAALRGAAIASGKPDIGLDRVIAWVTGHPSGTPPSASAVP